MTDWVELKKNAVGALRTATREALTPLELLEHGKLLESLEVLLTANMQKAYDRGWERGRSLGNSE